MPVNKAQQIPVDIVGGSTFGRYPSISLSKTYNMYVSDGWLVNYPGFKKQIQFLAQGEGRGIFVSIRGGFLLCVVSSVVYKVNKDLTYTFVGHLESTSGFVSIDENLNRQICICDGLDAYIYNYETLTFTKQNLTFLGSPILPNYVSYHNTFFLIGSSPNSLNPQNWYTFVTDTPSTIKENTQHAIQTKPDTALLIKRIPGRGNNIIVLGSTVGEVWTQVGGVENYRRIQSYNIDHGIVSVSTLAANDQYVCYLAQNEDSAPFLMVTDGSSSKRISSDGIDYVLSTLKHPEQSTAFFYQQDGHLFYQITFFNQEDNLTLVYDFTTQMFFHASDESLHYYPARQNALFDGAIYFVSINDGSLYLMDTNYITYDYETGPTTVGQEIPRIRICTTVRKPDSGRFRVGGFTFTMEQGVVPSFSPVAGRVDMSYSKNNNQSFSNIVSRPLNPAGHYRNQIRWWRMGQANSFTIQLRFWGFQRFVCNNGVLSIV